MKRLLYAFRFLTIIPIPLKQRDDLSHIARSVAFYPIVGMILGGILIVLAYVFHFLFEPVPLVIFLVCIWILFSGGLHLDGLCDTIDGLGGGDKPSKRLEIMKDSRTGVFGVIAIVFLIVLKIGTLFQVYVYDALYRTLLLAPILGRFYCVYAIYYFPKARNTGIGAFVKTYLRKRDVMLAFFSTLITAFAFGGLYGLALFILLWPITCVIALFFRKYFGGLTGDHYGAIIEFIELTVLVFVSVFYRLFPYYCDNASYLLGVFNFFH